MKVTLIVLIGLQLLFMISFAKKIEKKVELHNQIKTKSKDKKTVEKNKNNKLSSKEKINQNFGELSGQYNKLVKPLYKEPYFPQEVQSISKIQTKPNIMMHTPQIVGSGYQRRTKKLDQKPSIYKTILKGHQTSVTRPIPKLTQAVVPNNPIHVLTTFNPIHVMTTLNPINEFPVKVIENYSAIPIKVEKRVKPLSVEQIKMENQIHSLEEIIFIKSKEDINKITSKLKMTKNKKGMLNALRKGKISLEVESEDISRKLKKDVAKLIYSKELAIRLNNLLQKFEVQMKKSKLSTMKLADIIIIKKQLKEKLKKEIQGIRTSSSNYPEIKKVDPKDLKSIMKKIKNKLAL